MENQVKNLNDAISVLVQGVELAQKAGVYSFDDSAIVKQALDFLKAESQRNLEAQPEPKMEVVDATAQAGKEEATE